MLKKYYELLMRFHKNKAGNISKAVSLTLGTIFFLAVLPGILFLAASLIGIQFDIRHEVKIPLAAATGCIGLFWLGWATYTQLAIGKGTPAPNAPTQALVIVGPYKYTRNPIEFGALFYYFGFGLLLGTLFHGLVCLLLGFLIGSSYHKFVEEKELRLRFGEEYEEYRKRTPFLIPRLRRWN